ncbi:MAG: serine/threonine protein kinase, partial [Comamonadaceae bacterium]
MQETSFGRYQLRGMLGRGGMGNVYQAYDTATQRSVAIKVLPEHAAHDPEFRARFEREARCAARIGEPHIVPIFDFGEIDGRLFLSMQLIQGTDVGSLLAQDGPIDPTSAVAIIEQIAAALDAAHADNLLHRDVTPSNILLTDHKYAYLIDFGIARAVGDTSLTATGATIGTFAYMAPERFKGEGDARVDVYALACVLHECLTAT